MNSPIVLMTVEFNVTDGYRRALRESYGGEIEFRRTVCDTQEQLDALDGAGVFALISEMAPRQLSKWKDLKFVQLVSAGTDHLGRDHPIWTGGIPIATATGIHSVPM